MKKNKYNSRPLRLLTGERQPKAGAFGPRMAACITWDVKKPTTCFRFHFMLAFLKIEDIQVSLNDTVLEAADYNIYKYKDKAPYAYFAKVTLKKRTKPGNTVTIERLCL
jgi:hypothetical protein